MSRPDPWQALATLTAARIALGRAGNSLPTAAVLSFDVAHALARDAVHQALDVDGVVARWRQMGGAEPLVVHSRAIDRHTYLQRPDLGRCLDEASTAMLLAQRLPDAPDVAIVIADGLSARAAMQQALPLMTHLMQCLAKDAQRWTCAPVVLVEQGRVAIGDEIGCLLQARTVVVLIGERPGLSSPDSLGIYFTWAPRVGCSDADRNCISNVRDAGLAHGEAARRLHALLSRSRTLQLSGVALKDEHDNNPASLPGVTAADTRHKPA